MKEQLVVQNLLRQKYTEAQTKNPSYSLRAFALKLGIAPGALSQILAGSRRVSKDMAMKFCERLLIDPTEQSQVLKAFVDAYGATRISASSQSDQIDQSEYLQLQGDQFKVISEWYYFGILSLVKTTDFKNDPTWISNRLGISKSEASQAVDRLLRLGMLEPDKNGRLKRIQSKYRTTDGIPDVSVKKGHFQTLELAKKSLEQAPFHAMDFTHITMPTDPQKIGEAKKLIRIFQQNICDLLMNTKKPTEVYRVAIALFPLTQISDPSKGEALENNQ